VVLNRYFFPGFCPLYLVLIHLPNTYRGLGQLIGVGVVRSLLNRADEWSFRLPYALQWIWPVPLFIGVCLAPESPWWLVRKGRFEDAKHALERLTSRNRETDFDADETIDMMRHTTELEKEITSGSNYWDCFKGTDLRRTEIVCFVWMIRECIRSRLSSFCV
jgi:SP family general alpha glucoside:H+ symporter-like MFS transporter